MSNSSFSRRAAVPTGAVTSVSEDTEAEPDTLVRVQIVTKGKGIGIVATADNHLSAALLQLSPQRRAERRERLRQAFAAAVTYAIEHGARLFLVAGNLFDTPTPANLDRAFVAGELARLRQADIRCVAVSGSHDTPRLAAETGGESPLRVYDALDGLEYCGPASTLSPRLHTIDGLTLAVVGLSAGTALPPGGDPLAGLRIEDPTDLIGQADATILLTHAALEGAAVPDAREQAISRASLKALPRGVRLVVAGNGRRFSHQREGDRDLVSTGATERMDFGAEVDSSGFAWIELPPKGEAIVRRIPVKEQPRADLVIEAEQLFAGSPRLGRAPKPTTPLSDSDTAPASHEVPESIQRALAKACTPDTIVRLRLTGSLARTDLQRLALRDIVRFGQQHAFSFDLDTSGLRVIEPSQPDGSAGRGSLSPSEEIERLVAERAASLSADQAAAADVRAAADLLRIRLRALGEQEVSR